MRCLWTGSADLVGAVTVWNGIQPTVDAAFDLGTNKVPVCKLLLATSPRCGSHFAGSKLHATHRAGLPLEYFNPVHFAAWQARSKAANNHGTLSQIVRHRTGPNGCFSAKLHWPHVQGILDVGISGWLRGAVWVRIERLDTLAQAVSWEIAAQTGVWIHGQKAWKRPTYDSGRISARLGAILQQRHHWDRFFARSEISPHVLIYETLCDDPDRAIAPLLDLLPESVVPDITWPTLPEVTRQGTQRNTDWITRYLDETAPPLPHKG